MGQISMGANVENWVRQKAMTKAYLNLCMRNFPDRWAFDAAVCHISIPSPSGFQGGSDPCDRHHFGSGPRS